MTQGVPNTPIFETPRRPGLVQRGDRSSARRNLTVSFNEQGNVNSPLRASTPQYEDPAQRSEICADSEDYRGRPRRWKIFFTLWFLVFVLGGSCVYFLYKYFPGYMLLCFTKEFLISGILAVLCVVLISVIVKLVSSEYADGRDEMNIMQPRAHAIREHNQDV